MFQYFYVIFPELRLVILRTRLHKLNEHSQNQIFALFFSIINHTHLRAFIHDEAVQFFHSQSHLQIWLGQVTGFSSVLNKSQVLAVQLHVLDDHHLLK